jgi:uncharacterized membrane protein
MTDKEIDEAVAAYRAEVLAEAQLARADVAELEDHLRSVIDELRTAGMPAAQAIARSSAPARRSARRRSRARSRSHGVRRAAVAPAGVDLHHSELSSVTPCRFDRRTKDPAMYTKARIAGHSLHPMLIAFPVALYAATVVALLVFAGTHDGFWYRAAMWTNIAGVVMAAVAAIPGLIDFLSLPRRTRARSTGLRHAGFNVLSLVLFVVSAVLLWRSFHGAPNDDGTFHYAFTAPLVLSIICLLSTMVAGALGWTLVQTHHVGVRPTQHGVARSREDVDDLDELVATEPRVDVVEDRHFTDRILRH